MAALAAVSRAKRQRKPGKGEAPASGVKPPEDKPKELAPTADSGAGKGGGRGEKKLVTAKARGGEKRKGEDASPAAEESKPSGRGGRLEKRFVMSSAS